MSDTETITTATGPFLRRAMHPLAPEVTNSLHLLVCILSSLNVWTFFLLAPASLRLGPFVGSVGSCGDSCLPRRHTPLHVSLFRSRICRASPTRRTRSLSFHYKLGGILRKVRDWNWATAISGTCQFSMLLAPVRVALAWPVGKLMEGFR